MIEELRQLTKQSHMTNQQIAEKSNLPESTVARIFSGKTPNPTVATVVAMTRAMGWAPEDVMGGKAENDPELMKSTGESEDKSSAFNRSGPSTQDTKPSEDTDFRDKYYDDVVNMYKNELKTKNTWLTRLFWCLVGIMAFILFVLVFDILNPGFGFVMY